MNKCPHCGLRFHKTIAEAYGSRSGLGLFDLIPGIRDLPAQLRKAVAIVFVVVAVSLLLLGPIMFKLYHHLAR